MSLFLISIVGLILRLINLNQSFWLDEGASVEIASRSVPQLLNQIRFDFHPPLFYLLLKSWLQISPASEWLIRLPFVIISVMAIPVVYWLVIELFTKKKRYLASISALLLAINPLHVYYSQELRMYGLATLLTSLSWLFLLKIYNSPKTTRNHVFFVLFSVLNLYTFYGAFLNLFAQVCFVIFKKESYKKFAFLFVLILVFFVPFVPAFSKQLETGGYLKTALPGWSALSGRLTTKDLLLIPLKFTTGRVSIDPKKTYYLIGGFFSLLNILYVSLALKNKKTISIYFWLVFPLILASVISIFSPMLGYWRFLTLVPAFCLLMAGGIDSLSRSGKLLGVGLVTIGSLMFLFLYYFVPSNYREDWRSLSNAISRDPGLIIVNFPITFAPLKYYYPQGNYFHTQTSIGIKKDNLVADITHNSTGNKFVYYLSYLSDLTDPQNQLLNNLIDNGFVPINAVAFNGVGVVYQLKPPPDVK